MDRKSSLLTCYWYVRFVERNVTNVKSEYNGDIFSTSGPLKSILIENK